MFTLMVILAVIYVFLKVSNTRAKFAEADARRAAEEAAQAEAEAMEEFEEEEEIRNTAIDVDADTIETSEPEDVAFVVEEVEEVEAVH